MMSKKDVFAMGLAVASLLLLATASVSSAEGPAVMITNYTVEPEVLMPGDTGSITVTIKNMDTLSSETERTTTGKFSTSETTTTSTSSISAEIETIRLSSRSREIEWLRESVQRTEYYNVGALGPDESIKISLPIKAAASAHDGTYFPEVYIEVDNGKNVRFPVRVKVDSSEVEILEKDIPSEISLSESKQIAIVVANNRPNSVRGVNVEVKSKSGGLEFTPDGIYIGNLEAYEQRALNFTLTPLFEGDNDIYFEADYKNGDNEHHSAFTSYVLVKSTADVRLILVNAPEFVFKGDVTRIDFDVANGMAKDIKAVSVMPAIEGLRILPSEYFIGDMEVGDVFSASFDVYTTDLSIGDTTIPFTVVFKDVDTDKQYEMQGYEVHVEIREPQKSVLPNPVLIGALVAILVSVAVVIWVRVKRKRGRREKK
ncbi:hypothetical protein C5S32_12805 [ANME-1 cluster archaeon GoMg1]|nr:hypothetical protein [ANME-1 cluster archaeon GoMg1]